MEQNLDGIGAVEVMEVLLSEVSLVACLQASYNDGTSLLNSVFNQASESATGNGFRIIQRYLVYVYFVC